MGSFRKKAGDVVAAVKEAFMAAEGVEPETNDVIALLEDGDVGAAEDVVDAVKAYFKTKEKTALQL
jgi:hypothetical protein